MLRDRRRARGRWLLALAGVLALLLLTAPAAFAQQAPGQQPPGNAAAKKQSCDNISNPVLRKVCQAGNAPAGAVGGAVTAATAGVVATAGDSALRSFTNAVAQAGQWFLDKVGKLINGSTSPNVETAGWFVAQYRIMLALAVIFALPMLLLSVAGSIIKADVSQAIRSAFVYLPIAGIFSFAAPACAQILINSTDWLSTAIGSNASANAEKFLHDAGGWLGALGAGTVNPVAPVFGVLLAAIIVVLGAISIWIELILRSAAIYIAVLFLPIGFAAMVWPRGWPWCRKLIEFLLAIIFAKVIIVAIINLAAAGDLGGDGADRLVDGQPDDPVPLPAGRLRRGGGRRGRLGRRPGRGRRHGRLRRAQPGRLQLRRHGRDRLGRFDRRRQPGERRRQRQRLPRCTFGRGRRRRGWWRAPAAHDRAGDGGQEPGCIVRPRSATASGRWSGAD